jgi:hypothetical protein
MSNIILRIQAKRYRGISKSGKSHNFLTSNNGGTFFSIPKSAVKKWKEYNMKYEQSVDGLDMISIEFESWATQLGDMGRNLDHVLTKLISKPNQVIR